MITIKTTGDYTFSTRSDDGSVLYLDGVDDAGGRQQLLSRNDDSFRHGAPDSRPTPIALGYYEGGGGLGFDTTYSGPDTAGATDRHSQRGPRARRESAGGQQPFNRIRTRWR